MLKSDHVGIEIEKRKRRYEKMKKLKSDHVGIEIRAGGCCEARQLSWLKSDHVGIEIVFAEESKR